MIKRMFPDLFLSMVVIAAFPGCDNDNCPDKQPEITDANSVICTTYNVSAKHGNVGASCDPKYEINSTCCYGLNCDPVTATCVIGTKGRVGAACTSRGDCMSSLACNADHTCVEDTLDSECLAKQRD